MKGRMAQNMVLEETIHCQGPGKTQLILRREGSKECPFGSSIRSLRKGKPPWGGGIYNVYFYMVGST